MADTKISALTSLAATDVVLADDVLPIVDTSVTATKKITAAALKTALTGVATITAPTALASGTEAIITDIPQTYTSLLLVLDSMTFDTATRALRLRISSDNGSNFNASGFYGHAINNATVTAIANNASPIVPGTQTAAEVSTILVEITGYQSGSFTKISAVGVSANSVDYSSDAVFLTNTSATNSLKILINSTGDFDGAGSYALYGLN